MTTALKRRDFLKTTGGAALWIGLGASGIPVASADESKTADFNPFVRIDSDGVVTVIVKHFEMGQGTTTGLATLVAEELDVPWDKLSTEYAPANNEVYKNLAFGSQGTGGSTAIANSYGQYRSAAAAARHCLIAAAARRWNVGAEQISLEDGVLKSGSKSASLGEFVAEAATMTPPENPVQKSADAFRYIGKDGVPRKDSMDKTDGTAVFSMDVKLPGMVYATILRAPKFGATLKDFDAGDCKQINGFVDAKAMANGRGVVVYGNSTWASIKSRRALRASWDDVAADLRGTPAMEKAFNELLDADPVYDVTGQGKHAGIVAAARQAKRTVSARFSFPLLAHAPMEPLNCVIEPREGGGVRVHDGCQFPALAQPSVAAVLQLEPSQVEIKTYYAGGSFGRRANPASDYHVEAAMAFAALGGKTPVKLLWTREDDLQGGYYRPMSAHQVDIAVGDDNRVSNWAHQIAGQSIIKGTPFEAFMVKDGVDHSSVEGVPDTLYRLNNLSVGLSDYESPMTTLWWRSVGHSHTAYVMEVAMDMAAESAGVDPVEFRLSHLDGNDSDQARLAGVLKLVADKANWGAETASNQGRGVAVHKSFGSFVAQVVDVSVDAAGAIKLDKVTCALDCGIAVNPDVIKAQMEGGIGYGLGAVMRNAITLTDGVVDQQNFPRYAPLRLREMPAVEVFIVASAEAPSGVGEPGLPPAGPALANAIHAATGKRITRLPMTVSGVKFA